MNVFRNPWNAVPLLRPGEWTFWRNSPHKRVEVAVIRAVREQVVRDESENS